MNTWIQTGIRILIRIWVRIEQVNLMPGSVSAILLGTSFADQYSLQFEIFLNGTGS
jgi:hypothetical protein